MLQSISWSQYITALLFALICYYGYIAFKYFRWEILSIVGIKRIDNKSEASPVAEIKKQFTASVHTDFLPKEQLSDVNGMLQPFWDELNAYLAEIKPQAPKEEICFAIKKILEKYPFVNGAEYQTKAEAAISGLLNQYFPERIAVADMQFIWR